MNAQYSTDAQTERLLRLYAETRAVQLCSLAVRFNNPVSEPARQMIIRQVEELGEKAREVAWRLRAFDLLVPAALLELAGLSGIAISQTTIDALARAREALAETARSIAEDMTVDKRTRFVALEHAQEHHRAAQVLGVIERQENGRAKRTSSAEVVKQRSWRNVPRY